MSNYACFRFRKQDGGRKRWDSNPRHGGWFSGLLMLSQVSSAARPRFLMTSRRPPVPKIRTAARGPPACSPPQTSRGGLHACQFWGAGRRRVNSKSTRWVTRWLTESMADKSPEPELTPEEAERRAKELANRLLNTPPKPRPRKETEHPTSEHLKD